jgi:hypothetical protein
VAAVADNDQVDLVFLRGLDDLLGRIAQPHLGFHQHTAVSPDLRRLRQQPRALEFAVDALFLDLADRCRTARQMRADRQREQRSLIATCELDGGLQGPLRAG